MRFRIKIFQVLSDFETIILHRVRYQIKFFTTRQISKLKFHIMSDFVEEKFFLNQILNKNVLSKNHVLTEFTS